MKAKEKAREIVKEVFNPDDLSGRQWALHEVTGLSVLRDLVRPMKSETQGIQGRPGILSVIWDDVTTMVTECRRLIFKKTLRRRETFEQAVARLDLSAAEISLRQFQAVRLAHVGLGVSAAVMLLIVTGVVFMHLAAPTVFSLFVLLLTALGATVMYEFRAWQIVHRDLCSFHAWLANPERWFV